MQPPISIRVLVAIGVWRWCAEVLDARRRLVRAGVYEQRIAERLVRVEAGHRARLRQRFGVAAPVTVAVMREQRGLHAAVHVGRVGGIDVDDVGLLAAAMQRSHGVAVTQRARTAGRAQRYARSFGVRLLGLGLLTMSVGASIWILVRPLEHDAPWVAIAVLAAGGAGWLLARGHE